MLCHSCGAKRTSASRIGRQELCAGCGVPLHCCLNCRFFSEAAYHQCREEQAEFTSDKKSANFCDLFESAEGGSIRPDSRTTDARKKLDDLFKK